MTDIGELVAVGLDKPIGEPECVFDCDHKCTAENEFGRSDNFWKNVFAGTSTRQWKVAGKNYDKAEQRTGYKSKPTDNDWGWSAHHLIPVTCLKHSKIRKLMDSGEGVVRCHAGYGINGVENAAWLLYHSAMRKALAEDEFVRDAMEENFKRAGIGRSSKSLYSQLSGMAKGGADPFDFRGYLFEVMRETNRQFHDSHGGYNDHVTKALDKLYEELDKIRKNCIESDQCTKETDKPAATHYIVLRLNAISQRLETHLTGEPKTWRSPWFTSEFSRLLANEEEQNC